MLAFEIDLFNVAVPIDDIKEPEMADSALKAVNRAVTDRKEAGMRSLYNELSESCLLGLCKAYENDK